MELVLDSVDGKRVYPLRALGRRALVFFFITHDCPISNGYAPEVNRICTTYTARSIAFSVVYTESDTPRRELRSHASAFGYRCPALCDPSHALVRWVQATTTPEAAVLSPSGLLLYRGRIDDTYAALGKRRFAATTHDLREALEAVAHGKPVRTPRTRAIGCTI